MTAYQNIKAFISVAITTAFRPFIYRCGYFVLAVAGWTFGIFRFHDSFWSLIFLVIAIPALVLAVFVVIKSVFHIFCPLQNGSWPKRAGHAFASCLVMIICLLGYIGTKPVAIMYAAPKLAMALAEYRFNKATSNPNIEIISINPDIASYSGYIYIVLSPGFTNFVIYDETGRFAALAKNGRTRELASSVELRDRNYKSYCKLVITNSYGPIYMAKMDDADSCHGD